MNMIAEKNKALWVGGATAGTMTYLCAKHACTARPSSQSRLAAHQSSRGRCSQRQPISMLAMATQRDGHPTRLLLPVGPL